MIPVIRHRLRPPRPGPLITPEEPRLERQGKRVPARIGAGRP